MERLSVLDKLNILKDLVKSETELMLVFIFFIVLGILLFAFSKVDTRKYLKTYLFIYIVITIALIVGFDASIIKLVDYLINNVFYILVFPNVAVYILMVIIANILLLTGILGNKKRILKIVNIVFYSLISYLTFIVLNIIGTNKIDVYSALDIYSNDSLYATIQTTMIIFWIWIAIRIIIKIIVRKKKDKHQDIKEYVQPEENIQVDMVEEVPEEIHKEEPVTKEVAIKEELVLSESIPKVEDNIELPTYEYNNQNLEEENKDDKIEISLTKEEWIGLNDILKRSQSEQDVYKR